MNPWEILEISETSDEGAVKRAYARLLKIRRPDDDQQAFQDLRKAYDQALSICHFRRRNDEELYFGDECENSTEIDTEDRSLLEYAQPLDVLKSIFTIHDFIIAFNALARDYASYPNASLWLNLLERADELNFWEHRQLGRVLADTVQEFPHLPSYVWMKLGELFDWERERGLLGGMYPDAELDRLKHLGEIARLLCNEEVMPYPGAPAYLSALSEVYANRGRIRDDEIIARLNGLSVHMHSEEPPAALRLHLTLLHGIGDWQTLSSAHRFCGGHFSGQFTSLLRGEALRRLGDYKGALDVYKEVLNQDPDQADALRWSALCLERMGDAPSAVMRYRNVLQIMPEEVYSRSAVKRLSNIHTGRRWSWRSWYFEISNMLIKIILAVFILALVVIAVIEFFIFLLGQGYIL